MLPSNDVIIRPARENDDAAAIAKLIYLTDPYIYPFLCADFSDTVWVDFVRRALREKDHVHAAGNLLLAVSKEEIAGLICAYRVPSDRIFLLPVDDAVKARYVAVWEGYYRHAVSCESVYISNLCVDPTFRGRGIGGALLKALLDVHPYESVTLDVLANNASAVKLYERAGFRPTAAYNGFSGFADTPVKCLSMLRPPAMR